MKESMYKSYDELPLFLNAEIVRQVLGISISSAYELMHEKGFPSVRTGSRLIVPTTIDIYSHITDTMQLQAAGRIEYGIGNSEAYSTEETPIEQKPNGGTEAAQTAKFEPYKGKIRKSGAGGLYQIEDNLWEGRYTPTNANGKRESHNVYAHTREECEKLLEEMIIKVRTKIAEEKKLKKCKKEGTIVL